MKTVDVLISGSLDSPIGPTGTIKRLLKNKEYLRSRGYELNIFSHDNLKNTNDKTNSSQIKKGNNHKNIKSKLKHYIKKSRTLSVLFTIRSLYLARKLITYYNDPERKPDIIVFHNFFVYEQYTRVIRMPVKKVHFFHNDGLKFAMLYDSYPKLCNSHFAKYLERRFDETIKHLDKIVFISKIGQINFLKTTPFIEPSKTIFFHNGIDDLTLEQKKEKVLIPANKNFKYRLISTGTICERKGQYIVIEALTKINKDILENIHVTFLGGGSQLYALKSFVKKNNLTNHVTFEGSVPKEIVYKYLRQSNIYILMSNNEGLPISIIEAMRSELPIISTKVAGIPELVSNNYNGLLIEPNVFQLTELLNNIEKYDWEMMGKNSRIRFENEFTFDKMREAYCNMLDSLFQ